MHPVPPPPVASRSDAAGAPADDPPSPRRRLRPRDFAIPVTLSLGTLAGILAFGWDADAFARAAHAIRPTTLLLALAALALQVTCGGMRLRHVSRGLLSRAQGLRGQMTWDFMSALTPSAMGGAPFAAYVIAKSNRFHVGEITGVMLFAMLMDQIWFALLIVTMYVSAVWLPVFPNEVGAAVTGTIGAYLGGMLIYIGFFIYATVVRPELLEKAAGAVVRLRFLRRFEGTVRAEASKVRQQAHLLRGQPLAFYLKGALWTLGYWTGRYGVLLFVALSFTRDFRPVLFLLRTAGLWLAGLAMPTPGGAGGIEALFLLYVAPVLPDGLGAPVLLVWRLLAYHFVLILGAVVAGGAILRSQAAAPDTAPTETP